MPEKTSYHSPQILWSQVNRVSLKICKSCQYSQLIDERYNTKRETLKNHDMWRYPSEFPNLREIYWSESMSILNDRQFVWRHVSTKVFKGVANSRRKIQIKNHLKMKINSCFNFGHKEILNQRRPGKKYVFMMDLKCCKAVVALIFAGRSFHNLDTTVQKARSPYNCYLLLGTTRLKCWLDLRYLTGWYSISASTR